MQNQKFIRSSAGDSSSAKEETRSSAALDILVHSSAYK